MNEIICLVMFLYIIAGSLTAGFWYIYNEKINLYLTLKNKANSFVQRLKDMDNEENTVK
jgi:hypothetical protein